MANIRVRKGKNGTTYRVEMMRDGKRISKSFKVRRAAEKFAAQATLNPDMFDDISCREYSSLTIEDAVEMFLAEYKGRDSKIIGRLKRWCIWLPNLRIQNINKRHINAELRKLKAANKAPATINRYKSNLSSVFAFMCERYDISHNPCNEIKQQTEDNARTRFLVAEEIRVLLSSCKSSDWCRLYLLVLMALVTGARRSEMVFLRWSDVDFKSKKAFIKSTKNKEPKIIVFTDELMNELNKYRELGNGLIFPHPTKKGLPCANFDCYWKAARDIAGLKDFRFHDLRHTAASLLAMNGASLLEIADVLGHKSLTMTQRYAHLCTSHKTSLIHRVMGEIK